MSGRCYRELINIFQSVSRVEKRLRRKISFQNNCCVIIYKSCLLLLSRLISTMVTAINFNDEKRCGIDWIKILPQCTKSRALLPHFQMELTEFEFELDLKNHRESYRRVGKASTSIISNLISVLIWISIEWGKKSSLEVKMQIESMICGQMEKCVLENCWEKNRSIGKIDE